MMLPGMALAIAGLLAKPVLAAEANSVISPEQRQAIEAIIGEYISKHPDVVVNALQTYQAEMQKEQQRQAEAALQEVEDELLNDPQTPTAGNAKGDVTIVEFFDYNCGYCKRALSDMEEILKEDKNIRFVLKELPILGPDSLAAHKVSAAVRDLAPEKYGDFHRTLLGNEARATEESAIAVAAGLGLAEADIRKTMADKPHDDAVREAYTLANDLGITGTPSYVIAQDMVFGAVGAADLREKIANVRACGKTDC